MTIPCRRRNQESECLEPGDFAWIVIIDKISTLGDTRVATPVDPPDTNQPTHISILLPGLYFPVRLAIRPHRQTNSASWHWDRNWEQPTLEPSIDLTGIFHGHLRSGILKKTNA